MRIDAIPPRHNKTIWYLSRAKNIRALMMVLKFIGKRYLRMVGFKTSMNDELLVFIDRFKIYFAPLWAELDSYNGIFLKKIYEPSPEFLPENCQIIFDCGANIGIYTLRAAANGANRIFSIEPNPSVFSRLVKNINANNLKNVTALNTGIGSSQCKATLHWGDSTLGGSVKPNSRSSDKNSIDIEITTLDNIVKAYDISSIDLLKMDIEGSEYEALTGAEQTLRKTKRLILEFHSGELENKCESLLISRGFRKTHEITDHQFYVNSSLGLQR